MPTRALRVAIAVVEGQFSCCLIRAHEATRYRSRSQWPGRSHARARRAQLVARRFVLGAGPQDPARAGSPARRGGDPGDGLVGRARAFQGPDEITHASYSQQLAETGNAPSYGGSGLPVATEMAAALDWMNLRPTIGVPASRPAQTEVEERVWERDIRPTLSEAQRRDGTGPSPLAQNPPLYYAYEALPYLAFGGDSDLFDRMTAMRLANVVLFVLTVLLTWLLAVEIFGPARRFETTIATAVTALWPMLTFMGGVVNPDTALVTAYTLVALLAVRVVKRGPALGRVVALLAAAAACVLVHGRGAAAALVVLAALVIALVRFRPPLKALLGWAAAGGVFAFTALLVTRVTRPPAAAGGLYGEEAQLRGVFNPRGFLVHTWQFYFDRLAFMSPRLGPDYGYRQVVVERFVVGVFSGLEITYPAWVYDVAQYAIVLLVIGVWTAAVVHREQLRRAWPVLAVLVTLGGGLMLLLHAASYRALLGAPVDPLITGRYLLPLVPLIALALAWFSGVLPRWGRGLFAGGLLTILLLLQLGGLGMTVLRFHA